MNNYDRRSSDLIEIFHIEDNPGDIRLTEEAFKSSAYETEIRPFTNGSDAVERLTERTADESTPLPDLVLLDLSLAGQDGYSVLESIRADPELEHLPVIILSSSTAREDVHRSYRANANAYLTKPSDPGDFESLVDSIETFWFEEALRPRTPADGA